MFDMTGKAKWDAWNGKKVFLLLPNLENKIANLGHFTRRCSNRLYCFGWRVEGQVQLNKHFTERHTHNLKP